MLSILLTASIFALSIEINFSANVDKHNENKESPSHPQTEYVDIYSSCDPTPNSLIHTNNGLYYIKPFENGPVIPVICSNGYTMIDPSLDLNLLSYSSYLSSWDYSRLSLNYIITNLDDTSTFREWWLPSNDLTKFRVAHECKSCEPSMDPSIQNNVVYYTDGSNFCYTIYNNGMSKQILTNIPYIYNTVKFKPIFIWNYIFFIQKGNPCLHGVNPEACNKCDVGVFVEDDSAYFNSYWTECQALQVSADTPSLHDPQMRVNHHLIYRPVMSMTRQSCTCYQPQQQEIIKYSVQRRDLPKVTAVKQIGGKKDVRDAVDYIDPLIIFDDENGLMDPSKQQNDKNQEINCNDNIHYLTQNDFLYGTYRIKECGEYIFTEDIICNFNGPTKEEEQDEDFSPNDINGERLYWYPTMEQSNGENAPYPGLYTYEGSYSLGFFAGIFYVYIHWKYVFFRRNGDFIFLWFE